MTTEHPARERRTPAHEHGAFRIKYGHFQVKTNLTAGSMIHGLIGTVGPGVGSMSHRSAPATAAGFGAIALWALLALFTTGAAGVPRFQLLALTLGLAGGGSLLALALFAPRRLRNLRQPIRPWLLGTLGIFGYHGFYYMALDQAPPVDASLIAFLWPLLIVLFAGLLPGQRLLPRHVIGALLGLIGAGVLVARGGNVQLDAAYLDGYLAACACALTWSSYSVLNRRFGSVPTEAVAGFCAVGAIMALACHLLFETWITPTGMQWLAILGLGAGPVGAAFFFWDHATKHGNISLLGVLAYFAPLISTLLLIAFGLAPLTPAVAIACGLIVGGGLIASGVIGHRRPASAR